MCSECSEWYDCFKCAECLVCSEFFGCSDCSDCSEFSKCSNGFGCSACSEFSECPEFYECLSAKLKKASTPVDNSKGNRVFADPCYGDEDSINPRTHTFAATKG